MRTPRPLPDELRCRPFTVDEALALGVSRQRLRADDLRQPHRGVRVPVALPDTLQLRARAALLALPEGSALAGLTAVELCQLPLPRGLPGWAARPLQAVAPPTSTTRPRVSGVDAHHAPLVGRVHTLRDGLRVVHPRHLWCDLASELASFDDAVALADAVRRRWASADGMGAALDEDAARPGVVRAREVLTWVRYPVDSPMETRLRLLLVRAGLPEPVCGLDVGDGAGWVARPDLCWPRVRVAVEYDGDHHRTDRKQWRSDVRRKQALEDEGWRVIVLTADDVLLHPTATVARVEAALRERGLQW